MNVEMLIAIILFAATYIGLLIFPTWRAFIALASATIFVTIGYLPLKEVLTAVDWNVIMMLGGTMGIVTLFIESRMPALLSDLIIAKMPNFKWAVLSLALFAGIVSAFIDNVATVLMIAPLAITIARKINISPVDSIIAISVSSNLQGAATLVGDTTSILLGGHMGLSFADFFFYEGDIGCFGLFGRSAGVSGRAVVFIQEGHDCIDEYGTYRREGLCTQHTTSLDNYPSYLGIFHSEGYLAFGDCRSCKRIHLYGDALNRNRSPDHT